MTTTGLRASRCATTTIHRLVEELVDSLAKDARALLLALDGRELSAAVSKAATLLASVVGQDLDEGADGMFRIARRVAKDRIISTVDPDARHGHKTSARGFDGYKGHVAVDPDSELILATTVTAGNAGDAGAACELLADDLPVAEPAEQPGDADPEQPGEGDPPSGSRCEPDEEPLSVYGDSAYGSGELWTRSRTPTRRSIARSSHRSLPAAGSQRTRSRSTSTRARSPAPPGTP